jgi:MFS family permease
MPLGGLFIARYGSRKSIFIGLGLGVLGLLITSQGRSMSAFIAGAVLLAASTSFGGIIPLQTLVTHWFKRRRARVMAVVFTATPIWGALSYKIYAWLLEYMSWRGAIAWLTVIFPLGLALTLIFIRNRPEDVGEAMDGEPLRPESAIPQNLPPPSTGAIDTVELRRSLFSGTFAFVASSVAISTLPYLFFTTYGRLLLESLQLPTSVAVGALSLITLATLIGRLSISIADFVEPVLLIVVTMIFNIIGMGLILLFPTALLVNLAALLLGISFGLGFLLSPILISRFFGERLFTPLESTRVALVVGFNALVTPLVGYLVDVTGSFVVSMELIMAIQVLSLLGVIGFLIKRRIGVERAAAQPQGRAAHGADVSG